MAEYAALPFLLDKLYSLLQGGVQHFDGVHEEVDFIRSKLEYMRTFYRAAITREKMEPELEMFVGKLRDVIFIIEDILNQLTPQDANNNGHGFCSFPRKMSSSFKKQTAYRRYAAHIHEIKLEVDMILDRLQKNEILEKDKGSTSSSAIETLRDYREQALLLDEHELVGIEEPRKQLIDWLVDGDSKLKVIAIGGMGGLGKTTVAKKVYDDPRVKKHFQFHVWITVSELFKIDDLLKDILQQLYAEIKQLVPREVETMKTNQLKEIVKKFLWQSLYILVLDDVWTVGAWNSIKSVLPRGNGGRVMLTTRNAAVASSSSKEFNGHNFNLKPLSWKESEELFFRRTFKEDICPPHLQKVSQSILGKCEGLPLAIIAISGLLITKNKNLTDEWEMVNRSLGAELRDNNEIEFMKEILSLSYEKLPYNVKSCFLYLSIFPENHPIECVRLIRLWVAERFAEAVEGRTAEEVAEGYLKLLWERNLIQVAEKRSDGRVKKCRVHDILHRISILKSRGQNFAAIAKQQDDIWSETIRRLSVHNTLQNMQQIENVRQIRSLFMFGLTNPLSSVSTSVPESFKMLNVLDLQGAPLEKFPSEIVKLSFLRYLSLRNTKVEIIPPSIGKLRNLQTLDLKQSYVSKLPSTILKLKKLRHLLVYRYIIEPYAHFNYKYGFEAPLTIGDLQSLQKLCFIEAKKESPITMTELGRLKELRRLGIIKLRREDGKDLCFSIEKLDKLRALSITAVKEEEVIDLQCKISPPPHLKRLYLTGRLEKLPEWILLAHSLVKLFIKGSRLKQDPFEHLQNLLNLIHLELLQVFDGEVVTFASGGFQKLQILGLDKFNDLKSIDVEKGAMPRLEKLIIQRCNSLRKVPSGIEYLTKLKVLEFFEMPEELIGTLRPNEQGEDYFRVAHIPQVYSTYWSERRVWDIHLGRYCEGESSSNPRVEKNSHEPLDCWK
ncbi:hypothetical protein JCGZ_12853 [Jatropha curcas]|uniref:NB-ARC domain-containing protein n=1 Tax=Jatropha curcas TaxID=180498 RepID=A0A067KB86_JATCU|nr:hypothetical protein JCGZ_12853 [Jatropha curcas]